MTRMRRGILTWKVMVFQCGEFTVFTIDTVDWNWPRPPKSSPSRVTSFGKPNGSGVQQRHVKVNSILTFYEPSRRGEQVTQTAVELFAIKICSGIGMLVMNERLENLL